MPNASPRATPARPGQRRLASSLLGALHRHRLERLEEQPARQAGQRPALPVLRLGQEDDLPGHPRGMTMLSMNDRWLLATISGPVGGMCSRPSMVGRQACGTGRGRPGGTPGRASAGPLGGSRTVARPPTLPPSTSPAARRPKDGARPVVAYGLRRSSCGLEPPAGRPPGLARREDGQRRVRRAVELRQVEGLVPGVAADVERQPPLGQLRGGVLLAAVVVVLRLAVGGSKLYVRPSPVPSLATSACCPDDVLRPSASRAGQAAEQSSP